MITRFIAFCLLPSIVVAAGQLALIALGLARPRFWERRADSRRSGPSTPIGPR